MHAHTLYYMHARQALHQLSTGGYRTVPVVDPASGKPLGVLDVLSLVKFALDQRTELPKATAPKPTRPLKPAASTGNTTLLVGGLVLACTAAALAYLRPAVVQKALARLADRDDPKVGGAYAVDAQVALADVARGQQPLPRVRRTDGHVARAARLHQPRLVARLVGVTVAIVEPARAATDAAGAEEGVAAAQKQTDRAG